MLQLLGQDFTLLVDMRIKPVMIWGCMQSGKP